MSCCLRAATRMGKTMVTERGVAVATEDAGRRRDKGDRGYGRGGSSTATSMWSIVAVGSLQRQHCPGHMHNPIQGHIEVRGIGSPSWRYLFNIRLRCKWTCPPARKKRHRPSSTNIGHT